MAFAITRLANDPIVIVTVALPLDRHLDSFRSTNQQLNRLAATIEDLLYIIFDTRDQDITFSDILIGLDELDGDPANWIKYPHVTPIGVGTHPMLKVGAKRALQQLRVEFSIFATLDEALADIRAESDDAEETDHNSDAGAT